MIKVFEDFDISLVGHYQSVLESNDIATFMKNQFGTSGAGELPFVEVIPQLWVLNEADTERAKALIRELHNPVSKEQPREWICPRLRDTAGACFYPLLAMFICTPCKGCRNLTIPAPEFPDIGLEAFGRQVFGRNRLADAQFDPGPEFIRSAFVQRIAAAEQ